MKKNSCAYNRLIIRELLPPPISWINVSNESPRPAKPALLHEVYTLCGRAFLCLLLTLPLALASCDREVPASDGGSQTRSATADSTRQEITNLTVETDWAGQRNVNFDELQDDTLSIAIPEGTAPEGNINDAI